MSSRDWARSRRHAIFAATILSIVAVTSAHAGLVNLGGGWTASWDNSLDEEVSVTNVSISPDGTTIFLRKNAEFTQGPKPSGLFPSISITFQQIAVSTVTAIVIEDEVIVNHTNNVWNDFHFNLVLGGATFNPGLSAGFNVSPFTNANFADGNTAFNLDGGTVADGAQWTPGSGPNGGQLVINVISGPEGQFTNFSLKERPSPGPTALVVLATGLSFFPRRRRLL